MRRAVLSSLLLTVLACPVAAQSFRDHLQCHRINDPFQLRGTVDVETRSRVATGCRLGRAKLLCTPAGLNVVAGEPVDPISGRGVLDARVCYPIRCRRPPPPSQVAVDEFGHHVFVRVVPKFLCTPAVLGAPQPLADTLDHQECYRVHDSRARRATVETNAEPHGLVGGCRLGRAKLVCNSAKTTNVNVNVSPLLDLGAGTDADDDRVCYRVKCPVPRTIAQLVSDRFATRTVTKVVPKLVCSPAPLTVVETTTTTTTTRTTTTLPAGTEQGLVCQRTIEADGMYYANQVMSEIEGCAAPGLSQLIGSCLNGADVRSRLAALQSVWDADMAAACGGVSLRHDLGYPETCPIPCNAPSTTTVGVRACLSCLIQSTLADAATSVYANRPVGTSNCHATLGNGGLGALRTTVNQLDACVQQPGSTSVAACFMPALAAWRSQAESTCAGIDPFGVYGYAPSCSGFEPVAPGLCAAQARPCSFPGATGLNGPGINDDLLDCLGCRIEEAALILARTLHGTNLCCIGGVCNQVLTRFACRTAGGIPARYRIDSLATGPVYGPHGVGWGLDGAFYIADSGGARVVKVSGGTVTVVGSTPPFPTGVAADATGTVYVTNRCQHTITRILPGGASSLFAGTPGTPGSSGDGGPASAALISAPDGITVDPAGNVYFTESQALSFGCAAKGSVPSERVRVIDPAGNIHFFAGTGAYGVTGEGGSALAARLALPYGLRWTPGSLLVGEAGAQRVLRVATGLVTRVAGRPITPVGAHSGYGGPAPAARFYQNCGVAQDPDGNVIIAPMEDNRIALVDSLGSVITIAGTGEGSVGTAGDGGLALQAQAGCPEDVDVGPDGRVYFSDLQASRIRVLTRELF